MTEAEPLITPPPALGPPIIGTDTPGSAPGTPQPVFKTGSATAPTAASWFPQAPVGTWLPPPEVGFGQNTPFPTPVVPPGVGPTYTVPGYASGSGTAPTAASLFPAFTAAGPNPPIVINAAQNVTSPPSPPGAPPAWIAPPALPLPTTPGTHPIMISTAPNIPQLPWASGPAGLPGNTVRPTITGTPTVGQTLTAHYGTWTNSPTSYHYEWLENGSPLAGIGDKSTMTLLAGNASGMISVIVTAINAAGEASAESLAVGPVSPSARQETPNPPKPTTHAKPTTHSTTQHRPRR